jgi:hypothetical protein
MSRNIASLFVLVGLAIVLAGCGNRVSRVPVKGNVTLDGKPIADGYITFKPVPGTSSPAAGGRILDGRFAVGQKGGLLPGKFRVEITASRPNVGKIAIDPETHKKYTPIEQYLPARYNTQSELTAEVPSSKDYSFELQSK